MQLTNRRRRSLAKKKNSPNLTQDMLNELNKHTLPGYETYLHGGPPPPGDYDLDAAWSNDRYYGGPAANKYKVRNKTIVLSDYNTFLNSN